MNSAIQEFNKLKVGNISNFLINSSFEKLATVIGIASSLATIDKTSTIPQ
jgi:hypothetical protein